MSLDRDLTMTQRKTLFHKSKDYLSYFFDNFHIENSHFYDRAKKIDKPKGLENLYCPCVELMNYKLLKDFDIHCMKNDEMFWNDTGLPCHDGYSYGDFSIELDLEFYQLEVTAIYNPKEYKSMRNKLTRKLINTMKYKDQGIIFVNLMDWFPSAEDIHQIKDYTWKNAKTKYNFNKVEAIFFIKHDLDYKVKKIEFVQHPNSTNDLRKLKEMEMKTNIR